MTQSSVQWSLMLSKVPYHLKLLSPGPLRSTPTPVTEGSLGQFQAKVTLPFPPEAPTTLTAVSLGAIVSAPAVTSAEVAVDDSAPVAERTVSR